ncbi:peptidoglycan editing factor PgeF [Persicitalea jodogahamensis]|uniref:Purine nucleoside phosphorylase n=1 Tax=Persicitalea jodogahamensis TaxID=402147 RepID=A0A8J3D2B1_9BACT|nr:peptidoglycan editing factor PgeF [Persicitalea jodogahamensis]GHB59512.1 laccase domain protein [Persicitalea jodogahamensis]
MSVSTQPARPLYRTPSIFRDFPHLVAAESTRHGGVSPAPFDSLNLGLNTDDTPENVAENRRRFWQALSIDPTRVAASYQIHGNEVLTVCQPGDYQGFDALITCTPGIALAVTIADCTPVLIYDSARKAIGAIHAGWRGTVGGIVAKTVAQMSREFGTDPTDCFAYIGTCIDECSFEVGDEVAEHFSEQHKYFNQRAGKFYVDLKKANYDQLKGAGLADSNIQLSLHSTALDVADYFSHRLEKGKTGRMLACISMVENG